MTPFEVNWQDLLELHVVKKLRQIVARRFHVELGFADSRGVPVAGAAGAVVCAAQAATVASALSGPRAAAYDCQAHAGRRELVAPISIAGAFFGCAFAAGDDDFLGELLELSAEEMVTFSSEMARRDRDGGSGHRYDGIIGRSRPMQELYRLLDKVIASDSTVLVQGENGTGKELIAKAIHYHSRRARERFVAHNCSAFNDNLLDSELFGHKKGAFTGAIVDKHGLFEVAHRGSFFLDEIGDMSAALQVKLLRVLQEGTFTPVGEVQARAVDVRIIAATNRDLKRMVERGEFREDLYYRVHVLSVTVPPLRERREDIPLLVEYFLARSAKGRRLRMKRLDKGCLERLLEYPWPGNIRELENEIERLVVLSGDDKLVGEELLSPRLRHDGRAEAPKSLTDAVDALERDLIYEVLTRTQWNKTKAAEELSISRRNLIRKVNKYKLEPRRAR